MRRLRLPEWRQVEERERRRFAARQAAVARWRRELRARREELCRLRAFHLRLMALRAELSGARRRPPLRARPSLAGRGGRDGA